MPGQDVIMERIGTAITLHREGDNQRAKALFAEIWTEISPNGDAFHRCTLAHYMADVQDDPRDELMWDLRALDAAGSVTDERAKRHHESLAIRGFYPSLHLNLAEDYRKLGDLDKARAHIGHAAAAVDTLNDDAYGNTIKTAIDRLTSQLHALDQH